MFSACGDDGPTTPSTGSVEVTAATTGEDIDSDGYTVTVNGVSGQSLAVNGSATISSVTTGEATVELSGLADNCTVSGDNPRTVQVTGGQTASTTFDVACTAQTGSVEVTTSTTGDDLDSDGYTVQVDGTDVGTIGINETKSFSGIADGDHTVSLTGVASNCTVQTNDQSVTVPASGSVSVSFDVSCTAQTGSVEVTTTTTGDDLDSDGYTVQVDGTDVGTIGINETKSFSGIAEGDRTVSLSGVATNCTVQNNDQSVTVPAGGSVSASFDVDCTSTTGDLSVTTSTTGDEQDPDGYTVVVDPGTPDEESQAIGLNETVTFTGLTTTDHTVELTGVESNCSVSGDNPRTVTVTEGGVSTTFDVSCTAPATVLEVTASTTGTQLDPDGYQITVDGTAGTEIRSIDPNATETFSNLDPDDYTVTITGAESNCWIDGENPRVETVTEGQTTSTTFDVKCFAPLKDHVVFDTQRDGNREIYALDPASPNTQINLTQNAATDWKASLSPDGTKVAFSSDRGDPGNHIYVMNADGSNPQEIHTGGIGAIWSPDGTRIAFDWKNDVWIMNSDGSGLTNVTNDSGTWDGLPDWHPDGTKIAFASERNGNDRSMGEIDVFVVGVDGSNLTQLTSNAGGDGNPAWSPDGTQITFSRNPAGEDEDVYIMNSDGTGQTNLTDPMNSADTGEGMSDWLPDGSKILFVTDRNGNWEVYSMNPDGSNPTNLSQNLSDDLEPQAGGGS